MSEHSCPTLLAAPDHNRFRRFTRSLFVPKRHLSFATLEFSRRDPFGKTGDYSIPEIPNGVSLRLRSWKIGRQILAVEEIQPGQPVNLTTPVPGSGIVSKVIKSANVVNFRTKTSDKTVSIGSAKGRELPAPALP